MRSERRGRFLSDLKFTISNLQFKIERRVWRPCLFRIAVAVFYLVLSNTVFAELLDRVVASVNNDVITWSELNQAVRFNTALGGVNRENLRAETLDGLVNRKLLIQEAHRLKFVDVSEQDVDGEIEKLKKRLGSDKAFADFMTQVDMSPDQLRKMLSERLVVERFVEKKVGLFIRISRDEALDYFNRNAARFKGKSFQDVQKEITAILQSQKLDQQMSRYLEELRSKAEIRVRPLEH